MHHLDGNLVDQPIADVIQSIYRLQGSGVLEVSSQTGERRLFFCDGELHLPPSNPLAVQLAAAMQNGRSREEIRSLMGRIATVVGGWQDGLFRFVVGEEMAGDDLIGPLPTAELVMAVATLDLGEDELLADLGGEEVRLVSRPAPETLARQVDLDEAEVLLLSRLASPRTLRGLLEEISLPRYEALLRLRRLIAVDLVEPLEDEPNEEGLVNARLLSRFYERIESSLTKRPLELDSTAHRERLADLLGRVGRLNHYELLGVDLHTPTDRVHDEYESLARVVHPTHAARLGLAGRDGAMRLLFERATEAYLVLSDPERRAAYDRDTAFSSDTLGGAESDPTKTAVRYFRQAQDLVEEEEYHFALELLRQAIKADPQAQYYALMAEVQERNPKWLRHAADSYRQGLQLDPDNQELRMALARTFEKLGDIDLARGVYRSALVRQPGNSEASEALERLTAAAKKKPAKKKKGLLQSLFGRGDDE